MAASTKRVAVYGTLKQGHENHALYLKDVKPSAALFASLPFRMYANDEYPMLVPAGNGERNLIWVEIYSVTVAKLKELDALELPYGYWRESVFVEELGEPADIYLHRAPVPPGFAPVASGDW